MLSDVYWNTHKKVFSVRQKGRVVLHSSDLVISKPNFVVSEKGRQRVLSSGVKNVHAFVRGEALGKYTHKDYEATLKSFLCRDTPCDFSFVVYDPKDKCGVFRVLCVIGDIPIYDKSEISKSISSVRAYVHNGKPQLKVKMEDPS